MLLYFLLSKLGQKKNACDPLNPMYIPGDAAWALRGVGAEAPPHLFGEPHLPHPKASTWREGYIVYVSH